MKKVLILGGGFSSIYATKCLERLIKSNKDIIISLVCEHNYFVFQPMLPGVAAGSIEASHIINPIRRLCKHVKFHCAKVDKIDIESKEVVIVGHDITRPQTLFYDELVIGLGLSVDMSRIPGMSEHALPIKTLGDAFFLRNEMINKLEQASIEKDSEYRKKLLTFVYIGGGFSGVETMGEVGDMVKNALKGYPSIKKEELTFSLVHSGNRILQELSASLGFFAQKKLKKAGYNLILNTRVIEVTPDKVILNNGTHIDTKTVVCTTGNAAHKVLDSLPITNEKGRIDTNEFFQIVSRNKYNQIKFTYPHLWAIGDCAFIPNLTAKKKEKNIHPLCPPTAQFATRQGTVCAQNILNSIKHKPLKPFKHKVLGQMAVIGHLSGVAEVMGFRFSGLPAFIVWRLIYWIKLPGIYCKCRVALDWIIHLIFPVDITQLAVFRTERITRSHFQKGSYIFHQGDISDHFYIIDSGSVEVIKENKDGSETVVAVLKEGASFGEIGLMKRLRRTASIKCLSPVNVLTLNRYDFKALTGSYSNLKKQLNKKVRDIEKENQTYNSQSTLPASQVKNTKPVESHKPVKCNQESQIIPHPQTKEEALKAKIQINPKNLKATTQLIDIFRAKGKYKEALKWVKFSLKEKPEHIYLLARLGDIYKRTRRYDQAISTFQNILKEAPANTFAVANLAHCYMALNKHELAEQLYQNHIYKSPQNTHMLDVFSDHLTAQGSYQKAISILTHLTQKSPQNINFFFKLIHIYHSSGNIDKANNLLKERLALETDPEIKKKLEKRRDSFLKKEPQQEDLFLKK